MWYLVKIMSEYKMHIWYGLVCTFNLITNAVETWDSGNDAVGAKSCQEWFQKFKREDTEPETYKEGLPATEKFSAWRRMK